VPDASARFGRAFAPNHVSGFFVPRLEARDPRGRGSVGAGLVLEAGVTATAQWVPDVRPSVRVRWEGTGRLEISEAVAARLLAARPGRLRVHLEHALPIGQGFGSSAAGAVATGLAVAEALELPRRRALEVAHLAELFGGGGLGGVAAILGGGLEVRVRAGLPPRGRVVRTEVDETVLVGTVGAPIRSTVILREPRRLRHFAEGERIFATFLSGPGWEEFWDSAQRFTDLAGLVPPRLAATLRGLRRRGVSAAQAMFGRSFFATSPSMNDRGPLLRWLTGERIRFREVPVARAGARMLPGRTEGSPS